VEVVKRPKGEDEMPPPDAPPDEAPPADRPRRVKVKLADGKERQIQSMVATSFWSADGKPMSAAQFLESLFGALPEFFRDEDELRRIWSEPGTRKALLEGLAEKGFGREPMAEMQKIIEAEDSDLFDVLAYVAFALHPLKRVERAQGAKAHIGRAYADYRKQAFLEFVLGQYVKAGVGELDQEKLPPLLQLKYHALADAAAELGDPDEIRKVFVGFQKFLYQPAR
jgi:type I restriction enzyme R subunit